MTFEECIHAIVQNRTKGSSALVEDICAAFKSVSPDEQDVLHWAFRKLCGIDPSMVVVRHCLDALESRLEDRFAEAVAEYEARWQDVHHQVANNLMRQMDFNDCTVLAHSHSGMVVKVARIVNQRVHGLKIRQTRSEPGGEGAIQCEELQQAGIDAELVEDDRIVPFAAEVDAVWLGVDQYNDTAFVNKVGSDIIVETCAHHNTPVFVLGDSRKHVATLNYTNTLFERVPFTPAVRLITEAS